MKYFLHLSTLLLIACNSSPKKAVTPEKVIDKAITAVNNDSCAISKKYENARFAESMVGPD